MTFPVFLIFSSGCVLEKFFFYLPPSSTPFTLFLSKSTYISHELQEAAIQRHNLINLPGNDCQLVFLIQVYLFFSVLFIFVLGLIYMKSIENLERRGITSGEFRSCFKGSISVIHLQEEANFFGQQFKLLPSLPPFFLPTNS